MWWCRKFLFGFAILFAQNASRKFFQESKLYIATSPHYLDPLRSSPIFFPSSISLPFSILLFCMHFHCGSLYSFPPFLPSPTTPFLSFVSYYVSGIVLGSRDRAMKPRRLLILCHLYSVRRWGEWRGKKRQNNKFQVRRASKGIKLHKLIDDLGVGKGKECFRWDEKSVRGGGVEF